MTFIFTTKDPIEVENFIFNYIDLLETGETISSAVVSIAVSVGTDPTPSAMLNGPAVIDTPRSTTVSSRRN